MSKVLSSGDTFRSKIIEGVSVLLDYVGSTLGPRGRNVLLHKKGQSPFITKDGVTVANHLEFEDPTQSAVIEIIKQASRKTNLDAGDGTTTSTVLAASILLEGLSALSDSSSPVEVKKGMDQAVQGMLEIIANQSRVVQSADDIKHVATISANGDREIGSLISLAIDKVGKGGSITIEESRSFETVLDLSEGFKFDSGYAASAFINDERRGIVRYENPIFLITDAKISSVDQILPSLEIVARENRPFVIVADEVEGQALAALIMNCSRGTMKVCAVKAPRYGEERYDIMSDLALSVGARFITTSTGDSIEKVSLVDFGSAKTVEVSRSSFIAVGGIGDVESVSNRILKLESEIAESSQSEALRIEERLTRLSSGVAVIRVGGATQVEVVEKKHRIEDALEAVRSALSEGVLPGGSTALLRALFSLEESMPEFENSDQRLGFEATMQACFRPFKMMAANCGMTEPLEVYLSAVRVVSDPKSEAMGYDFRTGEYVNLYDAGIIEPAKVTRCSLQNAVSVASSLLTANHSIVEE